MRSLPREKRCNACGEIRTAAEFHQARLRPDGLQTFCKRCSAARYAKSEATTRAGARYRARHREEQLARVRAWRRTPAGAAAYDRQLTASQRYRRRLREAVLDKFGRKCAHCGFGDVRALHVDHVHGNGKQDRKRFGHSTAYYRDVLVNTTGKYQLLCANCNWIKRLESPLEHSGRPRTKR